MYEIKMPINCPCCKKTLKVSKFICDNCITVVKGDFDLPILVRLDPEDQEFVVEFLKASGSLKDMAKSYGVSYPTLRNRLDSVIEKIQSLEVDFNKNKEERNGN